MSAERRCEEIINYLIQEGYRVQVSMKEVKKAIMHQRGIDERTICRWLKALETFDYLKPKTLDLYELNPLKIPHLMALLKENSQVKLQ